MDKNVIQLIFVDGIIIVTHVFIQPDENRDPELVQVAGQSVSSGEISVEDIEDIGPI